MAAEPYRQDIDGCLADAIGAHGLERGDIDPLLAALRPAVDELRARRDAGDMPLLSLPYATDDLAALEPLAARYAQELDAVVVLGTGGSSLGGRAVTALTGDVSALRPGRLQLLFMDNIDPHSFADLFAAVEPTRTGFLVVSKSGGTAETMAQFLVALRAWKEESGHAPAPENVTAVTEPGDRPLRRLAEKLGARVLDHDPRLGGRFSVLSLVGLLPAMMMGQDWRAFRAGAAAVLDHLLAADPADAAPATGAAVNVALARRHGVNIAVLLSYSDRLAAFGQWFRQLWAESLGKRGQGTTPVPALGAVDQHSQLQLYLDGPRDKFYSVLTLDRAGTGGRVAADLADDPALAYLAGRTMGDLLEAEQRATVETLVRHGRPVRRFHVPQLDERALGALMMHYMLETVLAARLLEVDPFDQPAVEEGKVLARDYLAQTS